MSEGGAVDAWNKSGAPSNSLETSQFRSVSPAFRVQSGDVRPLGLLRSFEIFLDLWKLFDSTKAITRVFDAAGDHAKMMEDSFFVLSAHVRCQELQSHRNIRLAGDLQSMLHRSM